MQSLRYTLPLKAKLFKDDPKLEACFAHDAFHIIKGASGSHVGQLQSTYQWLVTICPSTERQ
jgi:hypothetical protein